MVAAAYNTGAYLTQEQYGKTIYRAIVKLLHPDMNPNRTVSTQEMNLLYKANDFYKERNYEGLEKVYNLIVNPYTESAKVRESRVVRGEQATKPRANEATTLYAFFKSKGLEVIDKRDKGGALWVVGNPEEIGAIVKEACRKFSAGGNYAMNGGRSTGYRTAWFTKCKR